MTTQFTGAQRAFQNAGNLFAERREEVFAFLRRGVIRIARHFA